MPRTIAGDDNLATVPYTDSGGDEHMNGSTRYVEAGVFDFGEGAVTNIAVAASVAVTVPSITDPDIAKVDVDVASAFTVSVAVGDLVIVAPLEALPTNCRFQSAIIIATDSIQFTFGSEGGNVTGAAKNFKIAVIKAVASP